MSNFKNDSMGYSLFLVEYKRSTITSLSIQSP